MVLAPPPLPTRFPCWCRAVYSWGGESKRDLGFIEGDLIECLNAGDGSWWTGRLWRDRRTVGVFPSNFVEVLPSDFRPTTRSASPLPAENTPSPSTPQKSRTFRKPFEAYAKAPHYTAAKQPEVYRTNPHARPRGHSGESVHSAIPESSRRDHSPAPSRRDHSPAPSRRDHSPAPSRRDRSPAPNAFLSRDNSFNETASTRMRAYTSPAPSGYVSRGNSFNDGAQQYVPRGRTPIPDYGHRARTPVPEHIQRGRTPVPDHGLRSRTPNPDYGHGSRVNSYNTERGPSPIPPHRASRDVSPAPSFSYKPYRPPTRERVDSPPPPAPPPHRHVGASRHKQSMSYDSRHDVSRHGSNSSYDNRYGAGRHGSNSSYDKRLDLTRRGSNASYENRQPTLDRQASHLSSMHRPPPIQTQRMPSPSPPSPAASHMTPSPLREAMDGVIEQLDALGMPRDPTPEPPLDPWSPESFNMVNDRQRRKNTYQRPQTSMGIAQQDEGYETWSGGSSRDQSYQQGHREDKEQLPQLSNYVERMESRLKKMHQHSASIADLEDEAPKPPPKGALYERPKSSMGGPEERKLRGRKSAYDIGRNVLNRTFTTKTNSTSASSGNQSSTTQSSDRSLMSGSSAGAISATSAGSLARKTQKRAQSALGMRDADIERPETPFTGVTYHSSHASDVARPKSQVGFHEDAGLGGLVTPKPAKRSIFKKLLDTAKTGVASGRSSIAMGSGDSPRSSPFARSMPNVASPAGTAISHMTGMGSSGFGRDSARDMNAANGVDWVQVRRDVNRSNSLSKNERNERRDRCQMLDYPALNPVDELYDGVEGDEGADGQPVEDPIDYQALNLTQVDKNSRFVSSLPPMTTALSLATTYVCRPYRSDVQRLRAIFTWVSEKVCWEEDFEGEVDTRRVVQSKRACAEEYAVLVYDMCNAVGIHCEVVRGYLKTPGEIPEHNIMPRANHWWNAVLVDNEWRMIDCCLASPSYPRRHLYSSTGNGTADFWWFLARPTEICWTHIPEHHSQQHICPPQAHEVLLNLPCACPPFFKNILEMVDYNTAATRIEDLEMVHVKFIVPADVEVAAEVEVRGYTRDADGDVFESGEMVKKRALAQAEWFNGAKRYTVKALLPGDEGQGVLKIYAGKRGLMHSIKDIPHPMAFALPIIHTGENPPYEFVTRHPTPHAQRHDIYVVQPQCQRLALNNTFVFAIRQHPSSLSGAAGSVMTPSSNPGGASPIPFARPSSALSMTASNASGSNPSTAAGGGKKPAKLAIQTPGGKILRLMRKEDRRGISVGGRGSEEEPSDGGTWETIIKCSEKGVWRGLVLADRTARWCVFAEWVCVG
ncbi:variant SH3 domain-containing protein [Colletotrichum plurivorum]|uniref:Variant SH3 domain-containing protein n=1 Tax=Colletotrichum plurivorum TaxID=2175906 RepID=A0A8H6NSA0_9PEZI|nr:variant SH3 domain-containing protein [Colletotrichum plurivorum]